MDWDQHQKVPIIKIGDEHYRVPTAEECREINRACDLWWAKKGLPNPSQGFQFLDFRTASKENTEDDKKNDDEA